VGEKGRHFGRREICKNQQKQYVFKEGKEEGRSLEKIRKKGEGEG
jgi:hypothetical protein